jgi:hypothetical protein
MKGVLIISVLMFFTDLTAQGLIDGFFKGKGNTDIALSATYQFSDKYFAGTKLIKYDRKITSLGLFAEHGITSRLDIIGNIPFINGNFQDGSFFLKYALKEFNQSSYSLVLVVASGVSFPTSNYVTESGQAIGQRATSFYQKALVQVKFNNGIFIQTQGGYTITLEPVAPSIPVSIKVGYAKSRWYFDAWYGVQKGIGNKDYLGAVAYKSFREFVVSYQRIGGVAYYGVNEQVGVFLSTSYVLSGRNIGKAYGVSTGLVLKLKA